MYLGVTLSSFIIFGLLGLAVGKLSLKLTKKTKKAARESRIRKAVLLSLFFGLFVFLCNGIEDLFTYIQNVLIVLVLTSIFIFPLKILTHKLKVIKYLNFTSLQNIKLRK